MFINVVFFAYLVNRFLITVVVYFLKDAKWKVNTQTNERTRLKLDLDLRSKSPAVSIRRCQDANTITMYGLSKSFAIKFSFSFQYFEIFYNNNFILILWLLTGSKWACYWPTAVLDRRDVLWWENANHQGETINSMIKRDETKQRRSKHRVKVSLLILFCPIFCPSTFVSIPVVAVKSTQKQRWYIFNFLLLLCHACNPVICT